MSYFERSSGVRSLVESVTIFTEAGCKIIPPVLDPKYI